MAQPRVTNASWMSSRRLRRMRGWRDLLANALRSSGGAEGTTPPPSFIEAPSDCFYRRIHGFLWDRLGPVQGPEVLDLGCGDRWLAEEMRRAGARVTGIDGSEVLLARARSRYPAVVFQQHDLVLGLPWAGRMFDRIVAHMVLMDIRVLNRLQHAEQAVIIE
jgi:2-polyprenyl-3-methyl-5-hydroxy-6-metoxy-1,4-benzoquinol methylase